MSQVPQAGELTNSPDEFYVGWMPRAPLSFARQIRWVIAILFPVILVIALVLSSGQKKFSTAVFEFGSLTELRGVYQQTPVPAIRVFSSADLFGNRSSLTIPLVGYGKFGAESVMEELEKNQGGSLNNRLVTLRGTLLYSDGKALLQVDEHDQPLVKVENVTDSALLQHQATELGSLELKGEILDPKCYFGVMKPGRGKPHRDCAVRCVEGGMSPVFSTQNERGEKQYYLLLGSRGEKINQLLKDYIADPVLLHARAVQQDDWVILYLDPGHAIERISAAALTGNDQLVLSCSSSPK